MKNMMLNDTVTNRRNYIRIFYKHICLLYELECITVDINKICILWCALYRNFCIIISNLIWRSTLNRCTWRSRSNWDITEMKRCNRRKYWNAIASVMNCEDICCKIHMCFCLQGHFFHSKGQGQYHYKTHLKVIIQIASL